MKTIKDYYRDMKSNEEQRKISVTILAEQLGCMPWQVKDEYKKQLASDDFSKGEIDETIKQWSEKKIEEGRVFEISPENTPAAVLENWTIEFRNEKF